MVNSRTFGRRSISRPLPRVPKPEPLPAGPAPQPPLLAEAASPDLDEELREWTKARRKNFRIPWRPLWLVAAPCFGIASLVLPDSVNDNVQWLLDGLMVASFCAGITRRRAAKH